jgi:hypothetical protein
LTLRAGHSAQMPIDLLVILCLAAMLLVSAAMITGLTKI